jgi:hypothetical protein
LKRTLKEYRPFIQNFARTTNLVSFFQMVHCVPEGAR